MDTELMEVAEKHPELKKMPDMFAPEKLHPDLEACKVMTKELGWCIQHPLVYSTMHADALNKMTNGVYEQKRRHIDELLASKKEGALSKIIALYERPYRLPLLMQYMHSSLKPTPAEVSSVMGWVWTDTENVHELYDEWLAMFYSRMFDRESFMGEDYEEFKKLKYPLTVYRGEHGKASARKRLSWTLDRAKAEWFARRWQRTTGKNERVLKAEVPSEKYVFGYLRGRNEEEIVVSPALFNRKYRPEIV